MSRYYLLLFSFSLLTCCQSIQPENNNNNATQQDTVPEKPAEPIPTTTKSFKWNIQNIEGEEIPYSVVSFSYGNQYYILDTLDGFVSACDLRQPKGPCLMRLPENVLGLYQGFYAGLQTEGYVLLNGNQLEYWQRYTDEIDSPKNIFELTKKL